MLGPKEFREVLRFLAMDEPPMLPDSTTADVTAPSQASRKRKFVEVPVDGVDVETVEGTGSSRQIGAILAFRCGIRRLVSVLTNLDLYCDGCCRRTRVCS